MKTHKIFSYVLRYDDGAAPNPYWDVCTLAICKPGIRKKAEIGDWILGTGNKKFGNDRVVYAMKVSRKKLLKEYDEYCKINLKNKIPKWDSKNFKLRVGDCVYDYSEGDEPKLRKSVHDERNKKRDLSGQYVLMSDHFYYFGNNQARQFQIPEELKEIIKKNQGYKKIEKLDLIESFEIWINKFGKNKIYGEPQLKKEFESAEHMNNKCAIRDLQDDNSNNKEEIVC